MIPFFPFWMIWFHPLILGTMQGNSIAPACNITLGNPSGNWGVKRHAQRLKRADILLPFHKFYGGDGCVYVLLIQEFTGSSSAYKVSTRQRRQFVDSCCRRTKLKPVR